MRDNRRMRLLPLMVRDNYALIRMYMLINTGVKQQIVIAIQVLIKKIT